MAQAKLMQCDTVKNVSQEIVNMHFTGKTAGVVNCETTLWSCSHFDRQNFDPKRLKHVRYLVKHVIIEIEKVHTATIFIG